MSELALIWVLMIFDPRGLIDPAIDEVFDEFYKCEFQRRAKTAVNPYGFFTCGPLALPADALLVVEAREVNPERRIILRESRISRPESKRR